MRKVDYYEILQIIKRSGENGILQSNLWKEIKATSKEGSRITLKLVRSGLIRRKRELYRGKWTYRLIPEKLPVNFDSLFDLPCTFCPDQERCGETKYITPEKCEKLTSYLMKNVKE
ncbi:MAG: Lrp/AsnC family transcriptional regulator [Candidatus Hecatellales archaeon]|nr:MAG: Lrp/AsnC family transcriptional regulator [Candidatus Hecatellales archaeon]